MIALFIDKVHLRNYLLLKFDLDIDTCGQVQLGKTVDGLCVGAVDVDQTLVCAKFELFTRVLVFVRSAKNGYDFLLCGKGDRSGHFAAHLCCRFNDFLASKVNKVVIVGLEFDSDFLVCHVCYSFPVCFIARAHIGDNTSVCFTLRLLIKQIFICLQNLSVGLIFHHLTRKRIKSMLGYNARGVARSAVSFLFSQ